MSSDEYSAIVRAEKSLLSDGSNNELLIINLVPKAFGIRAEGILKSRLHKAVNVSCHIPTNLTHQQLSTIILALTIFALSCKQSNDDQQKIQTVIIKHETNTDSLGQEMKKNINFISDTLLHEKRFLLRNYLQKYQPDTCGILAYLDSQLKDGFEGVKNIGDINGDKINDTVFVMPPFNYCDDGDSYCFFDTSLPRLFTDSHCCHPDNLFTIGDIDEDGISEICIFHSSCVSRVKSLIAYSLKNGQWKEIGSCGFDINVMKPDKEQRVRKISKGKFEMLEIIVNDFEKRPEGDREWKKFSF